MDVAFVTNGSKDIGYGHLSRTLLLKSFFQRDDSKVSVFVPQSCSFELEGDIIKVPSLSREHLETHLLNYDVAIIDSIEADYDELAWVGDTRLFIISITLFLFDAAKRYEHLSFYPSIDDAKCLQLGHTKLFTGRDYITFRPEFSEVKFSVKKEAKNVIITMGGTDPFGLTSKVLKSIAHDSDLCITVLLSTVSADYKSVDAFCNLHSNIKLIAFASNMAELFSQHDIAVINGGLTRYETCVVGIPFLALSIHQKQFDITQKFVDKGIGINIGIYNEVPENLIYDQVSSLLKNYEQRHVISSQMRSLFDTKGVNRIYDIVKQDFRSYEKNDQMG